MDLLLAAAQADPLQHVLAHPLHLRVGPFEVSNLMLMALVAAVLMLLIFPILFRKATAEAPTGPRNFFEAILEFLRTEVFRPALKQHTDRFVPFLWTLFFFILFCNLLGQIPIGAIVTLFTGRESHLGGTATGSLITTGTLAVCALIFIHVNGVLQVARDLIAGTYGHHGHEEPAAGGDTAAAAHGASAHPTPDQHPAHRGMNPALAILLALPLYLWNFAPHPFKPEPGGSALGWVIDIPMWAGLLVLELIGAVIKPFALMIRLFANMIAGHIVLAALLLLIPLSAGIARMIGIGIPVVILSLMISLLELFVAFLQAYIFVFLTTLFIGSAVAPEH